MNKNLREKLKMIQFNEVVARIESLEDFFETNYKIQNEKIIKAQSEYDTGLFLGNQFDKILSSIDSVKQEDIDSFNKSKIPGGKLCVGDILTFSLDRKKKAISYSIKEKFATANYDPVVAKRVLKQHEAGLDILFNSVLSNIIIIFEDYLKSVYFFFLISNPVEYFDNKTIPISSLFSYEHLIDKVINDEIDAALYDSMKCLNNILVKTGIQLDAFEKIKDEFEEIYYRRNLLVHNFGIINETYLSSISSYHSNGLKTGNKLITNYDYVIRSLSTLTKVITCLDFNIEIRTKKPKEDLFDDLDRYAFTLLSEGQYSIAKYIYLMLKSCKKVDFAYRLNSQLNYLNCKKHLGENISKELEELDVSATIDKYKIAKLCLSDEYEKVYQFLDSTYPKSFNAQEIRDWPIFIDFRKTEYYKKFVDEHNADFEIFEYAKTEE